jgi:hypothetical protein
MSHFPPLVAKPSIPLARTPAQPNNRIAKQRRYHHPGDDWESLRNTISRLYKDEGRKANDVVKILERDFAFKTWSITHLIIPSSLKLLTE